MSLGGIFRLGDFLKSELKIHTGYIYRYAEIRPGQGAIVPASVVFYIVIDDVAINLWAYSVRRCIEPPYFVKALACTGKDLICLGQVHVPKHPAAQVTNQRLSAAIVFIKLVYAHPVSNTV
jgi:hypothetical protein